jgi:hypothetical protein
MSKKNRPPKNVHKNTYEGRAGSLGGKQAKKQKGAYHPKQQNQGPSPLEDVEQTTYSASQVYASTRRVESRSNHSGSRSSLDFLALDKSRAARTLDSRGRLLPKGVSDWGCWWKMGDYIFQRIEQGENRDKGFEPSEVPLVYDNISKALGRLPVWCRSSHNGHILVELPEDPTYVSIHGTTVEIPYTKRVINTNDDYQYRRTTQSSEIVDFRE